MGMSERLIVADDQIGWDRRKRSEVCAGLGKPADNAKYIIDQMETAAANRSVT